MTRLDPFRGYDLVDESVTAGPYTFMVRKPRTADELISEAEYAIDERLPYWAELWPSGRVLADRIARMDVGGLRVVELGAGLALPSLVAARGGAEVVATDWYEPALLFVDDNAARLGVAVRTMFVDWRSPPTELLDLAPFDLVLGADILYEPRNAEPLASLLPRLLTTSGTAMIADPRRPDSRPFLEALQARGWSLRTDEIPHEHPLDEMGPIVHLHHLARRPHRGT